MWPMPASRMAAVRRRRRSSASIVPASMVPEGAATELPDILTPIRPLPSALPRHDYTSLPHGRARGPTVAGIRPDAAGQVVFAHCKIADTQELRQIHRASRMPCPKIALTMLILGSITILGTDARAQADAPGPARLAQAPTQPALIATPPSPPATTQPAAQTSPQTP